MIKNRFSWLICQTGQKGFYITFNEIWTHMQCFPKQKTQTAIYREVWFLQNWRCIGYLDTMMWMNNEERDLVQWLEDASSQIVTLDQEGIPKCHVSSTDSVFLGKSELSIHWNIERKGWWPFDSSIIYTDCTACIKYHWFE